jgi:DNA-directed RNA polymerase subunit RPC12/RpoP
MAETFECPNCSASLAYDSKNQSETVKCDYCGSTVIVPETLRRPSQKSTVRQEEQQTYRTI